MLALMDHQQPMNPLMTRLRPLNGVALQQQTEFITHQQPSEREVVTKLRSLKGSDYQGVSSVGQSRVSIWSRHSDQTLFEDLPVRSNFHLRQGYQHVSRSLFVAAQPHSVSVFRVYSCR